MTIIIKRCRGRNLSWKVFLHMYYVSNVLTDTVYNVCIVACGYLQISCDNSIMRHDCITLHLESHEKSVKLQKVGRAVDRLYHVVASNQLNFTYYLLIWLTNSCLQYYILISNPPWPWILRNPWIFYVTLEE